MVVSSSPRPKAARKSCAVGPRWRMLASLALYCQVLTGNATSRCKTSRESTDWKFAFRFLSESDDHEPLPGASLTPAVGAPVLALTALTKRTPPVARALNSLLA